MFIVSFYKWEKRAKEREREKNNYSIGKCDKIGEWGERRKQ
jgi:hypothetical protein